MLNIKSDVLRNIRAWVLADEKERGFLLGCTSSFDCIDRVAEIPAKESGIYFYTPNSHYASSIIQSWAKKRICFSGFMHSHTKGNRSFSDNDIAFAKQLLIQYGTPCMWFGLAVVDVNSVEFMLYESSHIGVEIMLNLVKYQEIM